MIDQAFYSFLEHKICSAFENSDNAETKGFWCDGVTSSLPEIYYSKKKVNDTREITLKAFIGANGQLEYELILKFGNKALSRYARDLSIQECVPNPNHTNWFTIDTEKNKLIIQLD